MHKFGLRKLCSSTKSYAQIRFIDDTVILGFVIEFLRFRLEKGGKVIFVDSQAWIRKTRVNDGKKKESETKKNMVMCVRI